MKLKTDSFKIGSWFYAATKDLCKMFPVIAEKTTEFPFGVYRKTAYKPRNTKDRFNYEETVSIEVVLCAKTYNESVEIAQKVKDRLEDKRGVFERSEITDIILTNANEDWSNDAYIQRLYFDITLDNHQNLYS